MPSLAAISEKLIIPGGDFAKIVRNVNKTPEKMTKSHKNVRSWIE